MITFIDWCRDQFGVEFIRRTYGRRAWSFSPHAGIGREIPCSVGTSVRDVKLVEVMKTVHADTS